MKLNKIDPQRVYDHRPAYIRLYNIDNPTQEELNWLNYIPMFVTEIFVSSTNEEVIDIIRLNFPNIKHETNGRIYAKRNARITTINITTKCNLACNNCSQFSQYPSTWIDLESDAIDKFINDNLLYGKQLTVKVYGGEPTIDKRIDEIIVKLDKEFHVVLVTNGIKPYTPPVHIAVENSAKSVGVLPEFHATCDAPCDDEAFKDEDYSFGCDTSRVCGSVFGKDGYYPCSIAEPVDRMLMSKGGPREGKEPLGVSSIEEALIERNQTKVYNSLCQYCGFYKRMGMTEAYPKSTIGTEQVFSKSWLFLKEQVNG